MWRKRNKNNLHRVVLISIFHHKNFKEWSSRRCSNQLPAATIASSLVVQQVHMQLGKIVYHWPFSRILPGTISFANESAHSRSYTYNSTKGIIGIFWITNPPTNLNERKVCILWSGINDHFILYNVSACSCLCPEFKVMRTFQWFLFTGPVLQIQRKNE